MKQRVARRRAIYRYVRREAQRRPDSALADCAIREHNRMVHRYNRNKVNAVKRRERKISAQYTILVEKMEEIKRYRDLQEALGRTIQEYRDQYMLKA
ncbi:MAG TPA: hypothetical protein VHK27_03185 [Gammaproteobacteria bacterium]|nr:hypothetical protein [Gammaproteobacteria bacterium]